MLRIIKQIEQLDIRQLMAVYEETNRINGAKMYGKLSENLQILYAEQDFYAYLEMFFSTSDSIYAVWAHEGVYKAALRLEQYCDGLIITGLETALRDRRKGYATSLLQDVIYYVKENCPGKLYSHIEKANNASLKLHQKVGFQKMLETATYIDGSFHNDAYTFCLEF